MKLLFYNLEDINIIIIIMNTKKHGFYTNKINKYGMEND